METLLQPSSRPSPWRGSRCVRRSLLQEGGSDFEAAAWSGCPVWPEDWNVSPQWRHYIWFLVGHRKSYKITLKCEIVLYLCLNASKINRLLLLLRLMKTNWRMAATYYGKWHHFSAMRYLLDTDHMINVWQTLTRIQTLCLQYRVISKPHCLRGFPLTAMCFHDKIC